MLYRYTEALRVSLCLLRVTLCNNFVALASFTVEKSLTGTNFSAIGIVAAKNGYGDQQYEYKDVQATGTPVYYRLKMIDKDASYKYSTFVLVTGLTNDAPTYRISPNPVEGSVLNIIASSSDQQDLQVSITDAAGRVWRKEKITAAVLTTGKATINVASLATGVYSVQLYNSKTGATSVLRFNK